MASRIVCRMDLAVQKATGFESPGDSTPQRLGFLVTNVIEHCRRNNRVVRVRNKRHVSHVAQARCDLRRVSSFSGAFVDPLQAAGAQVNARDLIPARRKCE